MIEYLGSILAIMAAIGFAFIGKVCYSELKEKRK